MKAAALAASPPKPKGLPKSQKIKRSHFATDGEYLAALRKRAETHPAGAVASSNLYVAADLYEMLRLDGVRLGRKKRRAHLQAAYWEDATKGKLALEAHRQRMAKKKAERVLPPIMVTLQLHRGFNKKAEMVYSPRRSRDNDPGYKAMLGARDFARLPKTVESIGTFGASSVIALTARLGVMQGVVSITGGHSHV